MVITRIYKSLVRHVTDMMDNLNDTGEYGIAYHSWETSGEEDKLPKSTLIGVDGFNFHENGGLWVIRFSVTLSSYQDINIRSEEHTSELQYLMRNSFAVYCLKN